MVDRFLAGHHKSPYHGFNVEFSEHRDYRPGDEIKTINWKLWSKTDKLYVKQFEEDTNLKCYIFLDVSRSMRFSGRPPDITSTPLSLISGSTSGQREVPLKMDYAIFLTVAFSYMLLKNQDAVGLLTFSDRIKKYIPPRNNMHHMKILLQTLDSIEEADMTALGSVLYDFAYMIKRRSLVLVISDLYENAEDVIRGLKLLRHKKHEVMLFHLLDREEIDFRYRGEMRFIDLEKGTEVETSPLSIRDSYRELVNKFQQNYEYNLLEAGIDYSLITTDTPFDQALTAVLEKRRRGI